MDLVPTERYGWFLRRHPPLRSHEAASPGYAEPVPVDAGRLGRSVSPGGRQRPSHRGTKFLRFLRAPGYIPALNPAL